MPIMGNKTINYNIYDRTNGRPDYVGDTSSFKRPALDLLTDTVKGSGIMGEIDMPSMAQLASMEIEIALKRSNKKAIELYGQKSHSLEVRWATDTYNSATNEMKAEANKEIIRGIPKGMDLGTLEANTSNEVTLKMEVIYYQYICNGESLIEIDKLNNVFKILGVDYAAAIREVL